MRESLPVSLVVDAAFCPRRAWLREQGVRPEGGDPETGKREHERLPLPPGTHAEVPVRSAALGVHGLIDQVRPCGTGTELVEVKTSKRRKVPEVTDRLLLQLAIYRLCAREEGLNPIAYRFVFPEAGMEVPVPESDLTAVDVSAAITATLAAVEGEQSPPRLEDDDPRCRGCSVSVACRPDVPGRIVTRDSDLRVLYLTDPTTYTSISQGRIRIWRKGDLLKQIPAETVSGISVFGNADLSSGLVQYALSNRIPITYGWSNGRYLGVLVGADRPHGAVRAQLARLSELERLEIARPIIAAKIHNQAAFLGRTAHLREAADQMRERAERAGVAATLSELLGVEGDGARIFFAAFPATITKSFFADRWPGRVGRGANDPLNILLNAAYGALQSEMARSVAVLGLDPSVGVLHSPARNKPALVLDLMEQFRSTLADRTVKRLINRGSITERDFDHVEGRVVLRRTGSRALYTEFSESLEAVHEYLPHAGPLTWRRSIEHQVRELIRVSEPGSCAYRALRVR